MTVQISLALSSGGAKGIAHIGVLEEAQVPIPMLTVASMGGRVAAIYAAGHSAAEIAHSLHLLDIAQRSHIRRQMGADRVIAVHTLHDASDTAAIPARSDDRGHSNRCASSTWIRWTSA